MGLRPSCRFLSALVTSSRFLSVIRETGLNGCDREISGAACDSLN